MTQRTRSIFRSLAPVLAPAILAAGAHAQLSPFSDEPAAKVRLISSDTSIAPDIETWLGVEFDIAPGWHIYWPGQNDSGYAPSVEWTLPEGFTVGDLQWPTPKRYIMPGDILDHTYEGRVVLLAKLTAPATIQAGASVPISAKVAWLECEEGCVPREAEVSIDLKGGSDAGAASTESVAISMTESRLPKSALDAVKIEWSGNDRVKLSPATTNAGASVARVAFYPHQTGAPVVNPLRTAEAAGLSLTLPLEPGSKEPLRGILQCWDASDRSLGAWTIDTPRGSTKPVQTAPGNAAPPSPQ